MCDISNRLSVCGSGIRDPIAYSLLGGGVPYPEHRLNWSLDSVPMFRFLCFLLVMVWSLPFPSLQYSAGLLALLIIFPVSSLFSSYLPPLRPFQCIQPTSSSVWSPIARPPLSVHRKATNPPAIGRPMSSPGFLTQRPICRFAPPPPPTCAAGGTWLGCGGGQTERRAPQ